MFRPWKHTHLSAAPPFPATIIPTMTVASGSVLHPLTCPNCVPDIGLPVADLSGEAAQLHV